MDPSQKYSGGVGVVYPAPPVPLLASCTIPVPDTVNLWSRWVGVLFWFISEFRMAIRNQSNRAIINIDTELSYSTSVKYCFYSLKSIADRDADPSCLLALPITHWALNGWNVSSDLKPAREIGVAVGYLEKINRYIHSTMVRGCR